MSGLVGRQLTVTDHLRHAGRPALGRLWLIAASSSPPSGSSLYLAEVHDALISTTPRDATSAGWGDRQSSRQQMGSNRPTSGPLQPLEKRYGS
jgi:hypothetical protein